VTRILGYALAAASAALWTGCGGGGGGSASSSTPVTTLSTDADPNATPAADPAYYNVPSTPLGAVATGTNVAFSYWNPFATSVAVNFYANWNDSLASPVAAATVNLTRGTGGVWTAPPMAIPATSPYYVYSVGGTSASSPYVLDPYARSMAQWVNAGGATIAGDSVGKGAIVDPAATLPDGGWAGGTYFDGSRMKASDGVTSAPYAYASNRDAIIYEAGIRDLTVDPSLTGFTTGHAWGTFKGLVDMLPHIQKLGVTHVQLLCPLENYYYDQTKIGTRELTYKTSGANYNWGYDPQNWFTPSGMYSSNPLDPASRVNELKTLINEIHRQGMGVILDVVFNHTASNAVLGYSLDNGYYYRSSSKNGAGSNDVQTEHKMVRKLILDALGQWVDAYHVDGFRFDLMGVIDTATLTDAYKLAQAANPNAILLGEGWNAYYTGAATDYLGTAVTGSDQNDVAAFKGMNVGMFSDSYRNLFKNGYPSDGKPAFLTGQAQTPAALFQNVTGQPTNFTAPSTNNVVNYLTCHDNLCYYDVLAAATNAAKGTVPDGILLQRAKVGYAVLMTSQGTAFLQAGDEMFRTKETPSSDSSTVSSAAGRSFCANSYNASDAVNMVRWSTVYAGDPIGGGFANYATGQDGYQLYAYTQGLIALRKSTNAFRLPDAAIAGNSTLVAPAGAGASVLAFGYRVVSTDPTPHTYYVFHNADTADHTFTVSDSLTTAALLVDGLSAGLTPITASTTATMSSDGKTITVKALSSAVFRF